MILPQHPQSRPDSKGPKAIGFWKSPYETSLPDPRDYMDPTWDPALRALVVRYLKDAKVSAGYRGFSRCRICEAPNGSLDQSDGTYVWPSGFAHYLEAHNVKPDEEFLLHVLRAKP